MNKNDSAFLGVALSGGGVRASLFALGALTYLVDSGESERVTEITSVSGGSITNGFVAQRCDFRKVKPPEFDQYASELARAITSGLVSKRRVLGTYGVLCAAVLVVTLFSWPADLSPWLDFLLIVLLAVLPFFRGVVLAYLFQRRLFGLPVLPTTLGSISSSVAHYFCATDLNAGMPVYLTNVGVHFYSPAWGRAAPQKAAGIRIADAVRSSAAFPGGIPPKRMDVRHFDLSPTPFHTLRRWQQLTFQRIGERGEKPSVLYLSDGGVWNNLGTDWFESVTGFLVLTSADRQDRAQQRLIVDATAPTEAKPRLKWFWVPYVAEVLALFRVWLVSYTSTVAARLERFNADAAKPEGSSDRPGSLCLARMVEPLTGGVMLGKLLWLGRPEQRTGRWTATVALKRLLHRSVRRRVPIVRSFARLHEWTSRVPTTFFSIPPEAALQLLVHGYVSTAHAMTGDYKAGLAEFPGIGRFAKLVGLEAHCLPDQHATFLGSHSDFKKYNDQIKLNAAAELIEQLENGASTADMAAEAAAEMSEDTRKLLEELASDDDELQSRRRADALALLSATLALAKQDYTGAVEIYDRVFSRTDLSDNSVSVHDVARYALTLARTDDTRARTVAIAAEQRLNAEEASEKDRAALAWWSLGNTHALLGDAEGAVRCLRRSLVLWPERVRYWLTSPTEMKDFVSIVNDAAFTEFNREIAELSG